MCVAPDKLEAAIDAIPQAKHGDCIIVNNGGFVEPILDKRAMCGQEQSQCVFYVTVNEYVVGFVQRVSLGPIGAQGPQVGEYAAETTVTGKWAWSLEERLTRHNFFCRTMSYRDWRKVTTESRSPAYKPTCSRSAQLTLMNPALGNAREGRVLNGLPAGRGPPPQGERQPLLSGRCRRLLR